MNLIQRPRGTRDFSSPEMVVRRDIENKIRKTAELFGYQEIATPTFEDAQLFIQKSGPEIVEQLYLFRDKGGRDLVLRPELTAPAIRFYANELYKLAKPLKIFYMGNCFRYERPQKGRFREFWQFGAELIGTDSPEGVAELIKLSIDCLSNVGLTTFELRLGELQILKNILSNWEIFGQENRKFLTALDKGDIESLRQILEDSGRSEDDVAAFFNLIQSKVSSNEFETRKIQIKSRFPTTNQYLARLGQVVDFLKEFNIKEFTIDLGIARGLDYYTGIVFEIDVSSLGAEKQVCGGGEYSLNDVFDLKDVNCSGFAIGFDRVVLAAELEGLTLPEQVLDVFFIPLSSEALHKIIPVIQQLRDSGVKVEFDIKGRNLSKNLKFASGKNAKYTVIVGDNELSKGSMLIRKMDTGEQTEVRFEQLVVFIKNLK